MTTRIFFPAVGCIALLLLVVAVSATAQDADCSADKNQFSELHAPLSANKYDKDVEAQLTNKVESFTTSVILRKLTAGADSNQIKDYLQCVTGRWGELSHTPVVFTGHLGATPLAVVATVIARDGGAVVDTKPLVQCFENSSGRWTLVGQLGDDFTGKTFDIDPLKSPVDGQLWYLLSGRTLGDTGGRLLVEVASCSQTKFETKWKRDDFRWGKVLVTGDGTTVELSYEKLLPDGRVPVPPPPATTEVLNVTPKGLR